MEENGGGDEVNIEGSGELLRVESNSTEETETGQHVLQQLTCMDASSFGQNGSSTVLPVSVHIADNSPVSQSAPVQLPQTQAIPTEQFHIVDQNGQPIQYELQALGDVGTQMMIVTSQSENGQVLHVIPSNQPGMAQVIVPAGQLLDVTSSHVETIEDKQTGSDLQTVAVTAIADSASGYILHPHSSLTQPKKMITRVMEDPFSAPPQPLPPSTPMWARRLRSCEEIGDSYRGYCASEAELESILTLHKQQTQSVWGTRQSPSPAKSATRLMWKSQYVPYDGIPFVNTGSRAIVMECQFGPRRKGVQPKKGNEQECIQSHQYKATCPARIYIKKVRKFPEYRVPTDPKIDKKIIRQEQEKAFNMLKKNLVDAGGVLRWYVQLPTQKAHQYHEVEAAYLPSPPAPFSVSALEEEDDGIREENNSAASRLHPRVAEKIRELVAQGIDQVYMVRKQLRKFVERELFKPDDVPERHNLSFFPTVNDIKNHIHEVQKALNRGEMVYDSGPMQWSTDSGSLLTETVTVTLTPAPGEGSSSGDSVITKVEATQIGDTLSPEAAQLLTSLSTLQPKIFAQLQGLQLQPAFTSADGATTTLIAVNTHQTQNSSSSSELVDSSGSSVANQPVVLGQTHFLQPSATLSENDAAASALVNLSAPDQSLVSVGQLVTVGGVVDNGGLESGIHRILLGDGQTIPVQIVDEHSTIENVESPVSGSHVKEEPHDTCLSQTDTIQTETNESG
ncbi:calcium-responsive transcription factor isoform X3 [Latimeria chalumnae]|uniref:Calcium responsive transcription factor n=1 Tax=Latimeria chalumnae TaxID=7897 RepID=H3B682_LATCH|nr:PREDICTED: calcium-responsive transcription factor isoform X3 [Latimeria chalumnae]|eukprot:XP_014345621.1 PREDICTED: calcium-responsive transcription factor isoform X3 [Latimeria chalumnae]